MKKSILILFAFLLLGLYSCSKEETIVNPPTNDTLSFSFNNLNDSIITINYAIGGSTSSQPVSWQAPAVNLLKNPLWMRFNMTYITSGDMTAQLVYNDTIFRQPFKLSIVKDSLRNNITGPANKVILTPNNFKGRGTVIISK